MGKPRHELVLVPNYEMEFEELYKGYPRKEGKTAGRHTFYRLRKAGKSLEWMIKCRDNYIRLLDRENRGRQYTKHFATFMNNIEDYEDTDGHDDGGPDDIARAILRGDL